MNNICNKCGNNDHTDYDCSALKDKNGKLIYFDCENDYLLINNKKSTKSKIKQLFDNFITFIEIPRLFKNK